MVVKFHHKMDNDSILTYHVHNSNIKIAALIMSTAVVLNIFVRFKDNKIISKCVYSVLGINMEGQKEILGT